MVPDRGKKKKKDEQKTRKWGINWENETEEQRRNVKTKQKMKVNQSDKIKKKMKRHIKK